MAKALTFILAIIVMIAGFFTLSVVVSALVTFLFGVTFGYGQAAAAIALIVIASWLVFSGLRR